MYTRNIFGRELKDKVIMQHNIHDIGCWAYAVYLEYIEELDDDFIDILLALNTMADGPEFEYSYEELEEIADDLIAGKEVKL